METFTFEHKITEQDYANLLIFMVFERKKFNKIFLLYAMPALGLLLLSAFLFLFEDVDFVSIFLSVFLILFGWFVKFLYISIAKKSYRKSKLLQVESETSFTETGIEAKSERGSAIYLYSDISKVHETNNYFYIILGMSHVIGISKEQVGVIVCEKIKDALISNENVKYVFSK